MNRNPIIPKKQEGQEFIKRPTKYAKYRKNQKVQRGKKKKRKRLAMEPYGLEDLIYFHNNKSQHLQLSPIMDCILCPIN
jgi:hypothetical protein